MTPFTLKVAIRMPSESVRSRPVPDVSKSGQAARNGGNPPSLYVAPILLTITIVIDNSPFYLMSDHGEGERLPRFRRVENPVVPESRRRIVRRSLVLVLREERIPNRALLLVRKRAVLCDVSCSPS